uniref:hypothetical protein n=1 Tax=Thaumasiovibrio occultus TaxID=1891184 RepID=UPI000B35091B|nr:hypothetical protein [Thaumasiovibrio occultus]
MKSNALIVGLLLCSSPAFSNVTENNMACYQSAYAEYVDISLDWYQDLLDIAVTNEPEMKDVADWFMAGRETHFGFNQAAFNWYLENEPQHLQLNLPVESWLAVEQAEVRTMAQDAQHPLQAQAQALYALRQGAPHPQNYALRSTFADLLSHPQQIDVPLNNYNQRMDALLNKSCATL